jgi:KDO2-lipid IV(A) lauroyltransferase
VKSLSTRCRYPLEWMFVRGLQVLASLVSMSAVRRGGRAVGRLAYAIDRSRRNIALENLEHAFPGRSVQEREALTRSMFAHFGSLVFELIKFGTYSREEMLAASDVEGADRVRQAYARGKGVLFFTGHFGYWEIFALGHPLRSEPVSVLARPLDNPYLHRMLEDLRTSTGNSVIYRQGAVRRMLRDLSAGRGIAVLIDQHLHSADAVYVGFFRRPAATTSALAALALRTGAPVIPVFCLPQPEGRYRFIYEHPVDPPRADSTDAVREFTQRCTDVLEMYVRRYPDLWLWMHRRWRDGGDAPVAVTRLDESVEAETDG